MDIETLKQIPPSIKNKTIPIFTEFYKVISLINENAPKIGSKKTEALFTAMQKLEDEIEILYVAKT
jgi:hypothetical protein